MRRFFLSKWEVISDQLTALLSQPHSNAAHPAASLPEHAVHVFDRALKELYRGLSLLRNYRIVNYTAFVKILKKHEKMGTFPAAAAAVAAVNASHFVVSPLLNELTGRCEQLYSSLFSSKDRRSAVQALRVGPAPPNDWMTFRLGTLVGLSLALLFVIPFIIQYMHSSSFSPYYSSLPNLAAALPVYRCLGLVYLNLWCWGLCVHLLHTSRINWTFILELDASHHMKFTEVVHAAAVMTFLWLGSLDLFLYVSVEKTGGGSGFSSDNPAWFPFALFWFSLFLFFMPVHAAHYRTRAFLLRSIGRTVSAPFTYVHFTDTFVGDQLCSLVNLFGDFEYSLCFFLTGDFVDLASTRCANDESIALWVLYVLPYWWRMNQCLRRYLDTRNGRFLGNAFKYLTSITITLLNLTYKQEGTTATLALWIAVAALGTAYIYYWDIRYDWGLLEPSCRSFSCPHPFLRPQLTKPPALYYFSMAANLVLRVSWVFTISPTYWNSPIPADYFKSIIYSLEILRRQQWNYYRLENEHLTNCEQYRVVNIVPLPMAMTDLDTYAHTAPEAAVLIRKNSDRELQQAKDEQKERDLSDQQQPPPPADRSSASQAAVAPISGRGGSPPRSARSSIFRRGRASRDPDSSPDSSPERGTPPSRRSGSPPSPPHPHPLWAAANAVALASAGVVELEGAMRAAAKVRESAGITSGSSKLSELREALNRDVSAYLGQQTPGEKRPGSGTSVAHDSPSSSGLRSSPDSSPRGGADVEAKHSGTRSVSRELGQHRPRGAARGPPGMRVVTSTPLLSSSSPSFDPAHVPSWLSVAAPAALEDSQTASRPSRSSRREAADALSSDTLSPNDIALADVEKTDE